MTLSPSESPESPKSSNPPEASESPNPTTAELTSAAPTPDRPAAPPIDTALPSLDDVWRDTFDRVPTADQQTQLQALYRATLDANTRINLTRIVEPTEFWEKHIWDSLSGLHYLDRCVANSLDLGLADRGDWSEDKPVKLIDVGTGGGFPGLPIAIMRPQWSVTLLDSTQKKIRVVQESIEAIGLTNCDTMIGRAERQSQLPQYAERYDLATVRAVGSIQACVEYTLPFLIDDGIAILYRGHWSEEDLAQLNKTLRRMEGRLLGVEAFETPLTHAVRHCVFVQV
jgi:16S rRNA (guanine527-N7)-methyltransferase